MILYLDTSALVKAYVEESGRAVVTHYIEQAGEVALSMLAGIEFSGVLARKAREGGLTHKSVTDILAHWDQDSRGMVLVPLSGRASRIVRGAMALCVRHGLRGADAVHLATALRVHQDRDDDEFLFLSADERLLHAARAEGLNVRNPAKPA